MITVEKNRSWTGLAVVAALGVAGALAWWALAPQSDPAASASSDGAGSIWKWSPSSGAADGAGGTPTKSILAGAGLTKAQAEDLAALEGALGSAQPNAKAEAARIVSYVQYFRAFETWQGLDEQKQGSQRKQLAEGLFQELPDRLKSGEFTFMEAALMGAVLIADAESDEARREERVKAWQTQLGTIVPNPEDETRMTAQNRETEYMRRRATAFSEWEKQTDPSLRTPAKLEQAMAEVRRAHAAGQ